MSSASLQTAAGSTATLVAGLQLAGEPLDTVLAIKEEPDHEEKLMQKEMQD